LLERIREEAFHSAQAQRLPVTPVCTVDEVLQDPQFKARGSFVEIEHPVVGKLTYPGLPFRLPETPAQPQQPAPQLGEHNSLIFGERLGYTAEDIVRLRELGVI